MKYIEAGSRYVEYAEEACAAVAEALGVAMCEIGYQNHTNRPVAWTQPDIEAVIERVDADHVVVVPIAFMREQSETLAELDHELREDAESRGLGFHRVPVPHDDPRLAGLLADVVAPLLEGRRIALESARPTRRATRLGAVRRASPRASAAPARAAWRARCRWVERSPSRPRLSRPPPPSPRRSRPGARA